MGYTRDIVMLPPDSTLSGAAYAFLADLVYRHSRIRLGTDKQALVAGRLAGRLHASGLPSYDAYCDRLRADSAEEEIDTLIDLIATNHTHFFREPAHFDLLAGEILAEAGISMPPTFPAGCSNAAGLASTTPIACNCPTRRGSPATSAVGSGNGRAAIG